VDGFESGEADLLDLGVDVFAFADGFVEGEFLDEEIFGAVFEGAADAGEMMGEVGEGHHKFRITKFAAALYQAARGGGGAGLGRDGLPGVISVFGFVSAKPEFLRKGIDYLKPIP
jgi:hypothetical protein